MVAFAVWEHGKAIAVAVTEEGEVCFTGLPYIYMMKIFRSPFPCRPFYWHLDREVIAVIFGAFGPGDAQRMATLINQRQEVISTNKDP